MTSAAASPETASRPYPGQKWVVLADTGETEIGTIVEETKDGFKVRIGNKFKILKRQDIQNIASASDLSLFGTKEESKSGREAE